MWQTTYLWVTYDLLTRQKATASQNMSSSMPSRLCRHTLPMYLVRLVVIWPVTGSDQGCQMVCFQTKNPNLGKFWRVLLWKILVYFYHSVYFKAIWNILWQFGIFFPVLVFWTKKNLATLLQMPVFPNMSSPIDRWSLTPGENFDRE
jgi:hypothetical protein